MLRGLAAVSMMMWLCTCGESPRAPCAGVNCGAGHCADNGGEPVCLCDSGFARVGLSCVDPCATNPCAPGTTCSSSTGAVRCLCADGVTDDLVSDCPPAPICPGEHTTGDTAEPDECATLAAPILPGTREQRTIEPRTDVDWFQFSPLLGHAYEFSVEGLPLLIEVFDWNGRMVIGDLRGETSARVHFIAKDRAFFVRVRTPDGQPTGAYVAQLTDVGPDDFENTVAQAERAPNPARFTGMIDYEGDVDVAWVEFAAHTIYAVRVPPAFSQATLELAWPDGRTQLLHAGDDLTHVSRTAARVILTARGSALGGFALELTATGTDDHPAAEPAELIPGGPELDGLIDYVGDQDVFFAGQIAGRFYRVRLFPPLGVPSVDASVAVFDADGQSLNREIWEAHDGRPATIRVTGQHVGARYLVKVEDLGVDDYGDDLTTATPITLGVTTGRSELPNDVDVFSFRTLAGHSYLFSGVGRVVDERNNPIDVERGLEFFDATTIFIKVSAGSQSGPVPYSFTLDDVGLEDHFNTDAHASPLTLGAPAAGLCAYTWDLDLFSFQAVQGHIYENHLTSTAFGMHTIRDATRTLSLSQQSMVPLRIFAPATQTMYLEIAVGRGGPANYTTQLDDLGVDDHSNSASGATPLSDGVPLAGEIQYLQDVDFFTAPSQAGHLYLVRCASTQNCRIIVSALDGSSLQFDDNSLTYKASDSGGLSISVRNVSYVVSQPYVITVTDYGTDDHGDDAAHATPLDFGQPLTGMINAPGDRDTFLLRGNPNDIISVTCTGGTSFAITDASTGVIATSFVPTPGSAAVRNASGLFFITVTGSAAGAYTLTTTLGSDDSTTPRQLTLGSAASGFIDYIGDRDDFLVQLSQPVTITLSPGLNATVFDPYDQPRIYLNFSGTFSPVSSGQYRIQVMGSAPSTFGYSLLVQ